MTALSTGGMYVALSLQVASNGAKEFRMISIMVLLQKLDFPEWMWVFWEAVSDVSL